MKNPVTQRSPCYSAVSALLTNRLPDRSNYSPLLPHPYLTRDQYINNSGQTLYQAAPMETILHCCSTLLQNLVGSSGETQCLEEAEQQAEASVDVPYPPLQIVSFMSLFSLSLSSLCSLSQSSLFSLSTISSELFVLLRLQVSFCFTNGTYYCILFHTMTYFFNNAFYKLVNTTS